ncbi:hypothetical protein H4218_004398 [Coemansia sp. IMI 209128]|nr:hypothetical protein H4218_004398 [Coemansia sp. IMI 209128]
MDSTDISRLLLEISQRRSQAVDLARALEQSIYRPHTFSDTGDEASDLGEDREVDSSTSFLDDFTRDFVDYYYTPPGPGIQAETIGALCLSEPEEEDERGERKHDTHEDAESEHEDRGVSKIDYAARQRIWGKIGKKANAYSEEEARIAALVERAEQLSLTPAPSIPPPPKRPDHAAEPEPPVFVEPWEPDEWEKWAAYKASDGSTGPLDWVHALRPNAWELGFRDSPCGGGKLVRTYSGLPLTLHSYADGNVKRTAMLKAGGVATTLFYDNGDWSCTIVSQGPPQSYYYYSEEGVWHEQCAGRQAYKYRDGSVESIVGGVSTVVGGSSAHVIV